jgi:hypothetical protein
MKQSVFVEGAADPEIYSYGVHWPEIDVYLTVGPGTYYAVLRLAETQFSEPGRRPMTVSINGEERVAGLDVYSKAGGPNKAFDLEYKGIEPQNGIIHIRFQAESVNGCEGEALIQGIEIGPDR